jgi:PP-loop superfamily ATP-utilizing enzyme
MASNCTLPEDKLILVSELLNSVSGKNTVAVTAFTASLPPRFCQCTAETTQWEKN